MIDSMKKRYKWVSVKCMATATAIQLTWINIPQDLRDKLPENLAIFITVSVLVLGIVGSIIKNIGDSDAGTS